MIALSVSPELVAAMPASNRLLKLAEEILRKHRCVLREIAIHPEGDGVVITGFASFYYGKQLAQHEVLKAQLIIVANRIIVE